MRIEFKDNWRAGDLRQERDTIADVRAGKVELAWVGARAWDSVGVTSFDALVAPFLIDSHTLEQRVFEQGIPQRMLRGTERAGVVGIGVLPGPLRTLLGVRAPLVEPSDFSGKTIGVQGIVAADTFRALGARPRQYFAQTRLNGLDGIEEQLGATVGNDHDDDARYLSANLNLWPRPLVLFAAPKTFRSLTPKQQATLRGAAAAVVPEAMEASVREDAGAARALCARRRLSFVRVSPAQVGSLRAAVESVYATLERDPQTRRAIRAVESLKRSVSTDTPVACARSGVSAGATTKALDGTWTMTVDRADLVGNRAYKAWATYRGLPPGPTEEDYALDAGAYRLELHAGRAVNSLRAREEAAHETGVFKVKGNLVVFTWANGNDAGETWTYRWSIFRGALTFSPPPPGHEIGPPNPMFAPWRRVSK
jgi:TRAP-type C4-dicarboxylate transport system substrate-binding protein